MVDLHMLDDFGGWGDDSAELVVERFVDGLVDEFLKSDESEGLLATEDDAGFWIRMFVDYGFRYESFTPPIMDAGDAEYVLETLLPRKVSLAEPEEADDALPELIAFWTYLERAYQLSNAKPILRYLGSVSTEDFRRVMFDSSRAGMAKSFVMEGLEAGFDMSDQEEMNEFMHLYNQQILTELADESDESELDDLAPSRPKPSAAEQSQQKKRRKTAKASRRKNRKSKKKKRK